MMLQRVNSKQLAPAQRSRAQTMRLSTCYVQAASSSSKGVRAAASQGRLQTPKTFLHGLSMGVAAAAAAAVMLCGFSGMALPPSALAEDLPLKAIFDSKCAGCHKNGGNILAAGATLFETDLKKNGVSDPESLYNIIYAGKAKMPGYGTDCAPRGQCTFGPRMTDDEIKGLASYTLERAAANWE